MFFWILTSRLIVLSEEIKITNIKVWFVSDNASSNNLNIPKGSAPFVKEIKQGKELGLTGDTAAFFEELIENCKQTTYLYILEGLW
jgi:hypothetical protein